MCWKQGTYFTRKINNLFKRQPSLKVTMIFTEIIWFSQKHYFQLKQSTPGVCGKKMSMFIYLFFYKMTYLFIYFWISSLLPIPRGQPVSAEQNAQIAGFPFHVHLKGTFVDSLQWMHKKACAAVVQWDIYTELYSWGRTNIFSFLPGRLKVKSLEGITWFYNAFCHSSLNKGWNWWIFVVVVFFSWSIQVASKMFSSQKCFSASPHVKISYSFILDSWLVGF